MIRFTEKFRSSVMAKALELQMVYDDELVEAMEKATEELVDEYNIPVTRWEETYQLLDSFYKYGDNLDY